MISPLITKEQKRPAKAVSVVAPSKTRRVRVTRAEYDGYRVLLANPQPPTERLRAAFDAQRSLADNEI